MTVFGKKAELTKSYIAAQNGVGTAEIWHSVMVEAISVMRACKREEWELRDIHTTGGRFLNSQLDLLSKWHGEADAARQSAYNEKIKLQQLMGA